MLTTLGQLGAMFTAPALAGAGLAAVSIPIAIHMLSRLRRQRVVWAAMRFLEAAYKRQRRRMQLEQWLLLLVRCLLLAILGLALAGPQSALLGALGLSQSSRLICVVLDDALTTRVTTTTGLSPVGSQRFDALKKTAIAIIDATQNGDRIALWTTSSPVQRRIAPGPVDRDTARKLIEALNHSYAKADMPGVMIDVNSVITEADLPADRVVLAVVSDFALGSLNPAEPAPGVMATLSERATIWLRRPELAAMNVQITSLTSTRGLLLASSLSPLSVPLTVALSRFGSDTADQLCLVHVKLTSSDGRQTRELQREMRWSAGQSEAVLNIEAPAGDMLPAGGVMVIAARVESISATDTLPADDARWTTLQVRQQLRVGLIDQFASATSNEQTLTQGKWLELALAPAAGKSMELLRLDPTKIDAASLANHDALLVLRPDRVNEAGWQALAESARQGRLVWVFTPADQSPAGDAGNSTGSAARADNAGGVNWPGAMRSAFDLPWSVGIEAMVFDEPAALQSDTRVPEALSMLGPDWQDMLRPVRLFKLLNFNLQTAPASDAWMTASNHKTVMASRVVGQGQLIFLAAAIDPQWTDLMVKPVFVPLVHETLRGVLGSIAQRQQARHAFPGQKLTLPLTWADVESVGLHVGPDSAEDKIVAQQRFKIITDRVTENQAPATGAATDSAATSPATNPPTAATPASPMMVHVTEAPLMLPGVYQGEPGADKLLAVNIQPRSGDTRAGAAASLVAWFGVDQPEPWLDQTDPGSMLKRTVKQADLGLPLLWTVLALLLLETVLARRFSHSQAERQGPSWLSRWWQRMVS